VLPKQNQAEKIEMAYRVTIKTLRELVDALNEQTGNPAKVWSTDENGNNKAHISAYVLDAAYGGYRLCQIVSAGGGERDLTPRGTARECADQIRAFMAGIQTAKSA